MSGFHPIGYRLTALAVEDMRDLLPNIRVPTLPVPLMDARLVQ